MADELNLIPESENEVNIYEERTFIDPETKMSVVQYTPVADESKNGLTLIEDRPTLRFGQVGVQTPMGTLPIKFKFPEEFSLRECFEKFEACAEQAVQELEREANQQIIVPKGVNANALRAK